MTYTPRPGVQTGDDTYQAMLHEQHRAASEAARGRPLTEDELEAEVDASSSALGVQ